MEPSRSSALQCRELQLGRPAPDGYDKMLGLIEATTTEHGLAVAARLNEQAYRTKVKISDEQMAALNLRKHEMLPQWNYTIKAPD